jgi:eukaryotic-like serine/threonine-protein kinase
MIGRTIANHEILELVGLGGAGEVYRALDLSQKREVALKILSERAEPDMVLRFVREARALALLRHPHIVEVYGSGVDQGLRYIVMELMPGATLRERLQGVASNGGGLPWREAVTIARQVAAALGHAHAQGIIHRDVKPGNVMFDGEGKAKLADFGLAHLSEASAMTRTGTVIGTVLYLSPEQAVGRPVDPRSDLYALGCVLYEMVTGQSPFSGPTAVSVIYKHLNEQPPRLRQVDASLPPALDAIVERLLQKDPARRFQSAEELVIALDGLLSGDPEGAIGGSPVEMPAALEAGADGADRALLPLAGRDAELGALTDALGQALSGLGRTVILAGEAGMGKTRLVHELARVAAERNALVLVGECLYGDAPNPYAPFVEILRAYDERRLAWVEADADVEAAFRDIRSILHIGPTGAPSERAQWLQHVAPQDAQGQAFELISRFFHRISRQRPLVLVLDDLQWASPTTLQLFHYLARGLRGVRLLLVGTYRPEDILPGAAGGRHPLREVLQRMGREHLHDEIALGALSAEAVGTLAAARMNVPALEDEFCALLHRESAGNPFYLLETLQLLQVQGALERVEGHWELAAALGDLEIPGSIRDVVMRRVEQAGEEDRELLDWAAIVGYDTAMRQCGDAGIAASLHRGIDVSLLAAVVGRSRLEVMRRLYALEQRHGLVASGKGDASIAGFAFTNAKIREVLYDQMPAGLRRESHLMAGEALQKQCAGHEEERIYDLAHHFVQGRHAGKGYHYAMRAAERAEAHYAPAEAIAYLDDALSLFDLLPQTLERAVERVTLDHRRGRLLSTVGRLDDSIAALESALAASRDLDRRAAATAQRRAGTATSHRDIARTEAEILLDLGSVHGRSGAWERAVALAEESLRLAEELEDPERRASALLSTAFFAFERGDWEGAVRRLQSALEVAREDGLELLRARILGNMAILYNARGDRVRAVELYQRSIDTFERLDQPLDVGRGLSNMGFSHYGLGAYDEAEGCYRRALELFERVGDVREQGLVYLHLAEVALAREVLDDARGHCTQAMRRFSRLGFELGMADVDRIYAGIAQREGRWAVAERYLREALVVYEDYGDQLNLAETHEELGKLLEEGGQAQKAAEELEQSRTIYHTLSGAVDLADA